MKLNQLMICLDCDEVSLKATECPICASRIVQDLDKWITPLSTLDKPEDRRTRREALFAEVRTLATKMKRVEVEMEEGPEHLGCGA